MIKNYIGDESSFTKEEAEIVIGKKIKRIESYEYRLLIVFTDDSELEVCGARWGDCSLGVEIT